MQALSLPHRPLGARSARGDSGSADAPPLRGHAFPGHEPPALRALPDFTDLVEQVGPAVVNIRTLERAARGRPRAGRRWTRTCEEFFRRFGIPMPGQPRPAAARTAARRRRRTAAARRRLGLHPQCRRLRDDQRARGRGRRRGARHADRQARIQGQGHRRRQAHRCGGREDRRHRPACGARSATSTRCGWASGSWPSARRSGSRTPSPPASSAPRAATPATSCRSSRPTWRSIPATPADR